MKASAAPSNQRAERADMLLGREEEADVHREKAGSPKQGDIFKFQKIRGTWLKFRKSL